MTTEVQIFDEHRCVLGEGPRWIGGALIWVDIVSGSVHRRCPGGARETVEFGQSVGFIAADESDRLVAGLRDGIAAVRFNGGIERWIDRSIAGEPDRRCNDGAVGPDGLLWVGTMLDSQAPGSGDLRCLTAADGLTTVRADLTIPNGLAWSADGERMFHIDSPRRVIEVLEFDVAGRGVGRVLEQIETPESMGYPDGMTIDADGRLWVAHWAGGCVSRWDPEDGELLGHLEVPASNVTACCFGGPDLEDLFVTTAQDGSGNGGEVYVCRPGVRGTRSYRLKGSAGKPSGLRGA
jgi:sugar lactone lactonase YvrE